MEGVDLPTRPIGRVWLRGLHAKHLYLGISGVNGDTRDIDACASWWNRDDLGYDFEPERTLLRRRREARRARQAAFEQQLNMAAENNDDNFNVENQNRVTLGQYINPTADSCSSTIRRPAIQANNFELKPSLI
ncbi:hypothetical protein PIB30_035415 [Stylosanthes scabra]|uniref:Uncharacterized protein n=1 Tax=Stylosanthes scabra TaxID=79078 RepID=A0ABU6QDL8_9FABA|nr:hypothetical protein [Stylosanthes scabra]